MIRDSLGAPRRHQDLPPAKGAFAATAEGHGIVMVAVRP
jgi:hypothetical protein